VVFGSSSLLQKPLEFKKLGLVVAGERGQYGQANEWVKTWRAPKPDVLLVTATPVPRGVALSAYAEWSVSEMEGPERPVIETTQYASSEREKAYAIALAAVDDGGQAVVLFPMSEEGDVLSAMEAVKVVGALEQDAFKGRRVGLFHGKMPREERVKAYTDFQERRLDVLVATTHFEVGPETPGLAVVIIEQADRMNVLRMHRLRGCLAKRNDGKCLLVTGQIPDEAGLLRVQSLVEESSGYRIASGELSRLGLAGMLAESADHCATLHWFEPERQGEVVDLARREAVNILTADPSLKRGTHREFVRYLSTLWPDLVGGEFSLTVSAGQGQGRRRRRRKKRGT
jgi:ATP-dependent DNA helicase RecG